MVHVVEVAVVVLDVSSPLLRHGRLEFGSLGCLGLRPDDDASVQLEAVEWVILLVDWSEEVRKWIFVNIRKVRS